MNMGQAVAQVASHLAANLGSATFGEATGLDEEEVSAADYDRLMAAIDEVTRRLNGMGSHSPVRG